MARPVSGLPTELELRILKILWERSPLPVREVREALSETGRELAHTTVITTLNVMVRKKYLQRTQEGKAYLFAPKLPRAEVYQRMLGDVVDRVFDGSTKAVMLSLFDCADLNANELKELRKLINQKAKEQTP